MNSICRSYTITLLYFVYIRTFPTNFVCTVQVLCYNVILTKVLEKGAKTPPTLAKTEAYP